MSRTAHLERKVSTTTPTVHLTHVLVVITNLIHVLVVITNLMHVLVVITNLMHVLVVIIVSIRSCTITITSYQLSLTCFPRLLCVPLLYTFHAPIEVVWLFHQRLLGCCPKAVVLQVAAASPDLLQGMAVPRALALAPTPEPHLPPLPLLLLHTQVCATTVPRVHARE